MAVVLIDPEYKGTIPIYLRPGGKLIETYKQDFKNEDYLEVTVLKQTQEYFYGTLSYLMSDRHINGWIKKANYIGVYSRNYGNLDTLSLYIASTSKSAIKKIIPEWTNQLLTVTSFKGDWVYVKIYFKGYLKEGWLAPNMQCSNPYTTCN